LLMQVAWGNMALRIAGGRLSSSPAASCCWGLPVGGIDGQGLLNVGGRRMVSNDASIAGISASEDILVAVLGLELSRSV
jgi:hypothetical protein